MAAIKLFGTKVRDESHKKLEEILAKGEYPRASCREDVNNADEPYTVWSDGPEPNVPAARTADEQVKDLSDAQLEKLADLIAARLGAK